MFEDLHSSELDDLLRKMEKIARQSPADYVPHTKQFDFHNTVRKIRAIFGGNRSGKTEAGAMESWYHASGDYPEWYQGRKFTGPTRGRIVVTDFKKGGAAVVEPKIEAWWPKERIIECTRFMGHLEQIKIRHRSGGVSIIEVLTHEQKTKAFEGWSGHWAWFDEPPPRDKYVATMRGLIDFKGIAWLTLTPLEEPWIYDELVYKQNPDVWTINVDMRDNPHLPKEEIEAFERDITEDEREARLHGKFAHLIGRVYKEFDEAVHVIPEGKIKFPMNWPTYFVLDPADRRPHHGLWFKVDPFGNMYFYQEFVFKGDIKATAKEILKRELMMGIDPLKTIRILDPNKGKSPNGASGLTWEVEFGNHAVYFTTDVSDDKALGHLAVKQRMMYDKEKPVGPTNSPRIYFVREGTQECIRQLLTYVWDDWKGTAKGQRDQKQDVKDINKDMPDCVRYACIFNPHYYNPLEGENDRPTGFFNDTTGYAD